MNCVEVSCSPAWIVLRSCFHRMCLRNTSYKIIKKIDWLVAEERSAKKLLSKVETALSCEIICQRWYWKNDFDYNDYKLLVGFWLMWFLVYLRSDSVKCIFTAVIIVTQRYHDAIAHSWLKSLSLYTLMQRCLFHVFNLSFHLIWISGHDIFARFRHQVTWQPEILQLRSQQSLGLKDHGLWIEYIS